MLAVAAIVLPYLAGRRPGKRPGDVIKGGAEVTDGDGIKVKGYRVRLAAQAGARFGRAPDAAVEAERVSCAAATRTRAASTATAAVTSRIIAAGRTRSER